MFGEQCERSEGQRREEDGEIRKLSWHKGIVKILMLICHNLWFIPFLCHNDLSCGLSMESSFSLK